jgi:hypothetical protein
MERVLPVDEILKLDQRGRVQVPIERREALLDEFERCGVSAFQFARRVGLKYQTFSHWVRKRKEQRKAEQSAPVLLQAKEPRPVQWIEAEITPRGGKESMASSVVASGVIISLPGGARIEVAHLGQTELVAELMLALQRRGATAC